MSFEASVGSADFFCLPFLAPMFAGGEGAGRLSWLWAPWPFAMGGSPTGELAAPFDMGVADRGAAVAEFTSVLALDIALLFVGMAENYGGEGIC